MERNPEILIVGGGIAGCALACNLHKLGHDVLLVERSPAPRRIFKGEFLQPGAVQYLEQIGFGNVFSVDSSAEIKELRFRDIDSKGDVASSITMPYPDGSCARSIEFFDLLNGFTENCKQELGENFWQGAQLTPARGEPKSAAEKAAFAASPEFTTIYKGKPFKIKPRWTIACDGRSSQLRKWLGGRSAVKNGRVTVGANEEFILGAHTPEIRKEPHELYEVLRLPKMGTLSIFSLNQAGQRIYLSAASRKEGEDSFAKTFLAALEMAKDFSGMQNIDPHLQVTGYPANAEWLGPPARGKIFLAGDALAISTPYGGQGMASALEHVEFLTEQVDWKSEQQVKMAQMRYAEHTAAVFDRIALLNFGVYYAFFARPSIFKRSTHQILRQWEKNPDLKARVARLFGGLDRDTPKLLEILNLAELPLMHKASPWVERAFRWT